MNNGCIKRDGDNIYLENGALSVLIDNAAGGKMRSFVSRRTDREYFFQDPRANLSDAGYSEHDISGFDECFPTVGPCDYPQGRLRGRPMGDHGLLWQTPWETSFESGRLVMSRDLPAFECSFEKQMYFDADTSLRIDYRIRNYGEDPLMYIYAAHILLSAGEKSELLLPPKIDAAYIYGARNLPELPENTWVGWPPTPESGLVGVMNPDRDSVVKLFTSKLDCGRCAIRHHDIGESLCIEFDTQQLPYLGVMISQGYDVHQDGIFEGSLMPALEPTNAVGDDLDACKATGTVREIQPGRGIEFYVRLSIQ